MNLCKTLETNTYSGYYFCKSLGGGVHYVIFVSLWGTHYVYFFLEALRGHIMYIISEGHSEDPNLSPCTKRESADSIGVCYLRAFIYSF